jgi:hypothetical protein
MVGAAIPRPAVAGQTATVLGDPAGAARAAGGVTMGVEEEFVLLDPATGAVALAAPDLVRMLDRGAGGAAGACAASSSRSSPARPCIPRSSQPIEHLAGKPPNRSRVIHRGPRAPAVWPDAAAYDAFTGQTTNARVMLSRLLEHVCPALGDRGDTETITGLLHRLDNQGTGADRQRALFAVARSAPAFVEALARATLPGGQPAGGYRPYARSGRPPGRASLPAAPVPSREGRPA